MATPGDAGTGIALDDPVVKGEAVPKAFGFNISTKDFRRWPGEEEPPVLGSDMFERFWAEARDDKIVVLLFPTTTNRSVSQLQSFQ